MVNRPPSVGLELRPAPKTTIEQRLVMTPPIASNLEEASKNAHRQSIPTTGKDVCDSIKEDVADYLGSEDPSAPYSDNQVASYLNRVGYEGINRRDVALARHSLGIAPSSRRYES